MVSPRLQKILRYLAAGGASTIFNLAILFILVHFLGFFYLIGAICSYVLSIGFGFALQKFWTFRDHETSGVHIQLGIYTVIALINLGVNTGLMYLFVSILGVQYLVAQVIAAGIIAFASYINYKTFVFKASSPPTEDYSQSAEERPIR